MTSKTDLRIRKSKYAIKHAFWDLLFHEEFSSITIQQIITKANVNRATLYKYYANKFALLDSVEDDLINEFEQTTEKAPHSVIEKELNQTQLKDYYKQMVKFIYNNGQKFYLLLTLADGNSSFANKLVAADKKNWEKWNLAEHLPIPEHYALSALIGMVINLIAEWARSDFKESPEEFVLILEKTIMPMFSQKSFFIRN